MKVIKEPTNKKTFVTFVLDASPSMGVVRKETVSGFNEQLQAVKAMETPDHEVFVSFILFSDSDKIETIRRWVKPSAMNPLTIDEYKTDIGGSTALLDALGDGMNLTEEKNSEINKPGNAALMIFVTDGGENSSKRQNKSAIKERITKLQNSGNWTFTFMGTESIDSVMNGYGISAGNIAQFAFGAAGMHTNSISNSKGLESYAKLRSAGVTGSAHFYDSSKDDLDILKKASSTIDTTGTNSGDNKVTSK